MKTTSSKSLRGLIFIAALAIPATTWWFSVRYYNAHKQTAETVASAPAPAQAPLPTVEHMQDRWRDAMLSKVREGTTIEAAPALRKEWTGPTDPDNVWRGQMRQANDTLLQHNLPALNASYSSSPGSPSTRLLRFR